MKLSNSALVLAFIAFPGPPASTTDPARLPPNHLPFAYFEGQTAPRREEKHLAEPNGGGPPGIALYLCYGGSTQGRSSFQAPAGPRSFVSPSPVYDSQDRLGRR